MTLPNHLLTYLAARDQQRADEMATMLRAMSAREVQILREAAVMGYVRGHMAGRVQESAIPKDSAILTEVLGAILSMPDLYPVLNLLRDEAIRGQAAHPSR